MSTIRPLATIAILAVVGVFLADKINKGPVATVTSESDWGAGNSAESTGGEVAPPSFSPTVAGDPSATPGVVSGVPPIGQSPLVETPGPAANPETASVLAPPTAIAIDPPEVPPLPPIPPAGGVTSNDPAGGAMGAPSPAAPPVTPSITPVDPLANLPLPDNIPAASYDASPTAAASIAPNTMAPNTMPPNTMPPMNPPPAVEGRVYGLPPEPSATASLPPAPPAASPAAPPVVPPGLPPLNPQVTPPSAPGGYSLAKPAIDAALARNELSRALLLLSSWRGDPTLTAAERQEVDTLLGQLAGSVIYSNDHLLEGPYTVRPGETLETIAQRHGVPWQLLGKINGVADPMAVTPGQTL
ncbi:MAG: LysM peptidoglycan-binding domain-containing protein, partial [Planctomycetota bacterium]